MLEALSPQRRRFVVVVVVLLALVVATIGGLSIKSSLATRPVPQDQPGPVLLVAGYGGQVASLDPLVEALGSLGRDAIVVRPVAGNTDDLDSEARHLDDVARQAQRDTGALSVDVIGYSAGGVIARLWVKEHGGAARARRVLTLGSPQHGTSTAALGSELSGDCGAACEQLVPDSDLLRRLNAGDETPAGPLWATVRTTTDQVVTPVDSAGLSGALNVVVQDICPRARTRHGDLPRDPVTLATLGAVLGPQAPAQPRNVNCAG